MGFDVLGGGSDQSILPTGAATAAKQDTGNASLASILAEIGQKTEPADQQHVIVDSSASIPVTGPLTDAQLRATPVPVSGTVTIGTFPDNEPFNLAQYGGAATSLGQKTMAASVPVAIASDQAAVPISGTVTGNPATAFGKTITYVSIAQGAAGSTTLAAASPGNRHKIVGATIIMDAAGTAKFTDGGGDLTGAMAIAASGGFVWGTSALPYQQTAVNSALSLVTTVGAAKGVIQILTEP